MECESAGPFTFLPSEIVDYILSFVPDGLDIIVCSFVCSLWHSLLPLAKRHLRWRRRRCLDPAFMLAKAAHAGHLSQIQWAVANNCPYNRIACELAARGGHLEVLQWLRSIGCPWDGMVYAMVGRGGYLEIMQ